MCDSQSVALEDQGVAASKTPSIELVEHNKHVWDIKESTRGYSTEIGASSSPEPPSAPCPCHTSSDLPCFSSSKELTKTVETNALFPSWVVEKASHIEPHPIKICEICGCIRQSEDPMVRSIPLKMSPLCKTFRFMRYRAFLKWYHGAHERQWGRLEVMLFCILSGCLTVFAYHAACAHPAWNTLIIIYASLLVAMCLFLLFFNSALFVCRWSLRVSLVYTVLSVFVFFTLLSQRMRFGGKGANDAVATINPASNGTRPRLLPTCDVFIYFTVSFFVLQTSVFILGLLYVFVLIRVARYYYLKSSWFVANWRVVYSQPIQLLVPSLGKTEKQRYLNLLDAYARLNSTTLSATRRPAAPRNWFRLGLNRTSFFPPAAPTPTETEEASAAAAQAQSNLLAIRANTEETLRVSHGLRIECSRTSRLGGFKAYVSSCFEWPVRCSSQSREVLVKDKTQVTLRSRNNILPPQKLALHHHTRSLSCRVTYIGEVSAQSQPDGFGSWRDDGDAYGERLIGYWRKGLPDGPHKSRELGTGSGFMCIRIGWGDYSLFDDVLRFGVSNVECSVSGKFYRRFPLVTMLHPPASDMTQSRSTSVCAAPCYPETELECSEEAKDELESSTVAKPSLCRYPSLSSPLFSDSSQEQHYALDFTEDESRLFPSWENPFLAQNASGALAAKRREQRVKTPHFSEDVGDGDDEETPAQPPALYSRNTSHGVSRFSQKFLLTPKRKDKKEKQSVLKENVLSVENIPLQATCVPGQTPSPWANNDVSHLGPAKPPQLLCRPQQSWDSLQMKHSVDVSDEALLQKSHSITLPERELFSWVLPNASRSIPGSDPQCPEERLPVPLTAKQLLRRPAPLRHATLERGGAALKRIRRTAMTVPHHIISGGAAATIAGVAAFRRWRNKDIESFARFQKSRRDLAWCLAQLCPHTPNFGIQPRSELIISVDQERGLCVTGYISKSNLTTQQVPEGLLQDPVFQSYEPYLPEWKKSSSFNEVNNPSYASSQGKTDAAFSPAASLSATPVRYHVEQDSDTCDKQVSRFATFSDPMNKQGAIEVGARLPSHKEDLGDLTVTIVRRRFVAAPSEQDKTLHESRRSLTGVERGGSVCRCACHFVTPVTNSAGVSSSHPHQEDKALNPRSSLETSLNAASQLPQPTTSKVAAHQNDAVSHRRATVTFLGKLSDAELPACALNSAQRSPATVEQQEIYHPNTTAAKLDPWDSQLGRPPPELEPKGWICMETAGSPEVLLYIHGYNNSHTESLQILGQMAAFGNYPTHIRLFLFSWPAGKGFWQFYSARNAAENAKTHQALYDMLRALRDDGIRGIHILCHSMGARLFLRSFSGLTFRLFQQVDVCSLSSDNGPRDHILSSQRALQLLTVTFLNPEYFLEDFVREDYATLRRYCSHITIFADAKDKALKWSERFSGRPALGKTVFGLWKPVVFPCTSSSLSTISMSKQPLHFLNTLSFFHYNPTLDKSVGEDGRERDDQDIEWLDLDVIDTTFMDQNVHNLRHSFWNLNRGIIEDIRELMVTRKRARQRTGRLDRCVHALSKSLAHQYTEDYHKNILVPVCF